MLTCCVIYTYFIANLQNYTSIEIRQVNIFSMSGLFSAKRWLLRNFQFFWVWTITSITIYQCHSVLYLCHCILQFNSYKIGKQGKASKVNLRVAEYTDSNSRHFSSKLVNFSLQFLCYFTVEYYNIMLQPEFRFSWTDWNSIHSSYCNVTLSKFWWIHIKRPKHPKVWQPITTDLHFRNNIWFNWRQLLSK